jgi:nucleoside-diphosphate-sugar epimerase
MRILVTGGMGEIGRPTVRWLLERGHEVRVLDVNVDDPIPGADCHAVDVTAFESLGPHMAGMEGVVHLAAYRHPGLAPEHELFRVNVEGTFNVLRAAADAGVQRAVCASSINALGYNFGIQFPEGQLQYFPIDEAHPRYTTDPYSFSKAMIESVGRYMWRREGMTSLFLRFPAVYDLDAGEDAILMRFVARCRRQTAEVLAMDAPARTARVREIVARFEAKARAREWEEGFDLSFPDAYVMFGRSNFWTSLDVRDAARAIEMGLLQDYAGSHAVYVTDTHNFVGLPSRQLAGVFFPEVTTWKAPVAGTEALVSTDRVRALIGFEPQYPFETYRLDGS